MTDKRRVTEESDKAQEVTLYFVHPTDSCRIFSATVAISATPMQLIAELIQGSFLIKLDTGFQYRFIDTSTGKELEDDITLETARVTSHTTLQISDVQ
jgi:hypothetical protein